MESISIANKNLQDPTIFYRILDKNALESILIANKILKDPARSCKILQDPTTSYKILRDTRKKWYGIHINSKQDPKRFYGILDKNAMEYISIANKILLDPSRSYKILQDSTGY